MSIFLDLCVVLIVGLLVVGGFRRGLIHSVTAFLTAIGATAISSFVASFLSTMIYDSFVSTMITDHFRKTIPEFAVGAKASDMAEQIFTLLPPFARNSFELQGITTSALAQKLSDNSLDIPVLLEGMVRPVMIRLVTVVLSLILFALLVTIVSLATKSITSAVDTAGLGIPNKLAGALLGLLEAVVLVMIMSLVVYFLLVFLPAENAADLGKAVDATFIYRHIHIINIPEYIMSLFPQS